LKVVVIAAEWLTRVGVRRGDVVALCGPNGIEFAIAWHAASSGARRTYRTDQAACTGLGTKVTKWLR
jgi:hypothetical protein